MSKLLIIGGSSGIGKAVLKDQMTKRACVTLSRSKPDLEGTYEYIPGDILTSELPNIEDIGGLVYCPGTINLKPIGSLKEEDFRKDFELNVVGAVKAIRKYHRILKKVEGSSIILFSTVAVKQGMAFHASVAAAKGAVEGLAKSLAAEFAPDIRVNVIAPTITDTPLASNLLRSDEMREKMAKRHPLKRIVEPSEISGLVNFLLSPAAAAITGQVLQVGNGITSIR